MRTLRKGLFRIDRAHRVGRLLVLCALVGVLAGVGAILFEVLTNLLKHGLLFSLAGYRPPAAAGDAPVFAHTATEFRPWLLALLPVFGGLVGGALVYWLAPEAEGPGTDAVIDAYHNRRGRISGRVPIVKTIASAITLGTGGSAGREGPIGQICAGIASVISTALHLSRQERRILMIAGMAAGIGAIFRAPLAGALFAAEVLYREMDMEYEVIVPAVISSIVAYSVFTLEFGAVRLFETPEFTFTDPRQLLPYFLLAFIVAGGAKGFVLVLDSVRRLFRAIRVAAWMKPMLGGVVVGCFAFFLPEALGSGYGLLQQAFSGQIAIWMLAAIAVAKIITSSFTIGSGQSGGVFGPAIVIGGLIGGALGELFTILTPSISAPQGAFVIVGMAGFFAAVANTPISTIILVSEMTGSYELLVPTMGVCVVSFLLVRRSTLYSKQRTARSDSPVHLVEMMAGVLEQLTVRDVLGDSEHEETVCVHAGTSLSELKEQFAMTHHAMFPVIDAKGQLIGVVDDSALRLAVGTDEVEDVIVAADLTERAPSLVPSESLHSAMHKMVLTRHDELVVLAEDDAHNVVGTLSRRDLIAAYDHKIEQEREGSSNGFWD